MALSSSPAVLGRLLVATGAVLLGIVLLTVPAEASAAVSPRVQPAPISAAAGRYLNLHQCSYFETLFNKDVLTFVLANGSPFYNAGTNVSNTPDSSPRCGPGNSAYVYNSGLSGVVSLDLSAGRYLNLHQCSYFETLFNKDVLTFVLANGSPFYNAGTNVSNTPDSSPRCGPGNSAYVYNSGLSGVVAIDLL